MANGIFLLCLLVSCLTVCYIECRGGHGGGHGGHGGHSGGHGGGHGGGHSSGGHSSGGHSSGSHSSGSHSYSHSSSGSSGYSSGSGSSSSHSGSSYSHSYPSSGSGLSGSSSGSHSYPSSGSGLSGSGSSSYGSYSNSHSYPPSGSGLSGSGSSSSGSSSSGSSSSSHSYPWSESGLSGSSSNSHRYPSSGSGLSGSSSSSNSYPSHNYPSSIEKLFETNLGFNSHSSSGSHKYESSYDSYNYPISIEKLYGSHSSPNSHDSSESDLTHIFGPDFVYPTLPPSIGDLFETNSGSNNYISNTGPHGSKSSLFGSSSDSHESSDLDLWSPGLSKKYFPTTSGSSMVPDIPKITLPKDLTPTDTNHGSTSASSGSHSYPTTSGGLSGSNSGFKHVSSEDSTNKHRDPKPSTGLSGQDFDSHRYPYQSTHGPSYDNSYNSHRDSQTHNTHSGHGSTTYNRPSYYNIPSYYTSPRYAYVHEYKNSNSRFGDLLTGLSLYNLGRSHNNHHDHFYHDDYFNRRYIETGSSYVPEYRPVEDATCFLRVIEHGEIEVLKIPCEIVSTFTQDSKKLAPISETEMTKTVCTTNSTMINNTSPVNINNTLPVNGSPVNSTVCTTNSIVLNPLTVQGPPANADNMECVVEIHTKEALFQNNVDCKTLTSYAKMPEPKKDRGMLPSKEKMKSWLSKPPWWASMFIAV